MLVFGRGGYTSRALKYTTGLLLACFSARVATLYGFIIWFALQMAENYHQSYLANGGQDASKGALSSIQCYGNRGPMKYLDKAPIRNLFHELEQNVTRVSHTASEEVKLEL